MQMSLFYKHNLSTPCADMCVSLETIQPGFSPIKTMIKLT